MGFARIAIVVLSILMVGVGVIGVGLNLLDMSHLHAMQTVPGHAGLTSTQEDEFEIWVFGVVGLVGVSLGVIALASGRLRRPRL